MNDRRETIKAMLRLIAGAAEGFVMGVKRAALDNPRLAQALKKDPELLSRVEDQIMDDLVPLYEPLDDETVVAVIDFYSCDAGRKLANQQKAIGPEVAKRLEVWQEKLSLAMFQLLSERQ